MVVTVNGERKEIAATHIAALLQEMEYEGTHFAVAVNYDVVPRGAWPDTLLKSGDEIEIISPRQGG